MLEPKLGHELSCYDRVTIGLTGKLAHRLLETMLGLESQLAQTLGITTSL